MCARTYVRAYVRVHCQVQLRRILQSSKQSASLFFLTTHLVLFSAITTARPENHTKHTVAQYGENVEFLKFKALWYIKRTLDFESSSGRGFRSADSVFL
jgi:hypothetical protein